MGTAVAVSVTLAIVGAIHSLHPETMTSAYWSFALLVLITEMHVIYWVNYRKRLGKMRKVSIVLFYCFGKLIIIGYIAGLYQNNSSPAFPLPTSRLPNRFKLLPKQLSLTALSTHFSLQIQQRHGRMVDISSHGDVTGDDYNCHLCRGGSATWERTRGEHAGVVGV